MVLIIVISLLSGLLGQFELHRANKRATGVRVPDISHIPVFCCRVKVTPSIRAYLKTGDP